jgi:tetratricopeptide (TPR) repeat protein
MPTINKPFLLKLILVVVALGGLLFAAHAVQARRIPDALRRQSERAFDAGKLDSAINYLRQYLEFEPDDVEAQERLAELLRRRPPTTRGLTDLVFLYDRILRLDPDRHPVRREALGVCLRLGRYSDAVTHAETLLAAFPTEAPLWQQLGAAQTGLNRLGEARKSYETAITHAPHEMIGYQRLAQLIWKNQSDPKGARAVLDRMVGALPQEPEAYLVRARFESYLAEDAARGGRVAGDLDAALADLHRVFELDPEHAEASLLLAEILQKGRNVPAAHAVLRDAVALYPRDLKLIRSLAWMELVRGNVAAATAVLEDGLRNAPDGFDLLVSLADVLVQQGDTARTAEIVKRLEARVPTLARPEARRTAAMQAKYLKARLAMREANWPDAVTLLEGLRAETRHLPGLEAQLNMLLATCAQRVADPAAEEKAYRRVIDADPAHIGARVGLANLHLNQGRFDESARELEAAARSPYATGGVVAQLVRLKARRLRGGGSADEWRKLEQLIVTAAPRFGPVSSEPAILRAEVLAAQGRPAEAVALLRKETARRPGDARLWAVLADLAAEAGGTPAGLTIVDEAQAVAGDGPDVRLARARLYAREPGRVRPVAPLAERIESWPEGDQLRLLAGLVEVYDEASDRAKVIETLHRIAIRRPGDAAVWSRLYERALAAGDAKTAAEARAAVARIEGDDGRAVVICDALATKPTEAKPVAERLVAAFGPSPNRSDACLALARLRSATGDEADAVRLTERAFVLEPTRYETVSAWVALLCRTGPDDRAAALLRRLATDPRWAGDPFRRVVAGVLEGLPRETGRKVVGWCRPLVEAEPGGLGWLAGCYASVGAAAEADAALVAATNLPTATSDDWLRLALHHATANRTDAAAATLAGARSRLTPAAYHALAAAYQETPHSKGWTPELTDAAGRRAFAQARLAVKLSRSEPAEAIRVLEGLLSDPALPKSDASWARRNLAMLHAVAGTPEGRDQAMKLLRDATDLDMTPDELRATASVLTTLARYLEAGDRQEVLERAARALGAAHKTSNSPKDLFNLAQLHKVAGKRKESRECLNALLQSAPKNIYYLVSALDELTEAGEFKTGETFAAALMANHGGEFRAVAAVARFECRAGRPERALALAEGYTRAADVAAGDYLTRSARVAELLDELARAPNVRGTPAGRKMTDAAAERYAALAPSRPEAVVAIAGVLAADGRVAEAFAQIDQHARYLPARTRALAGLAAVRSGGATESQFATAEGWLAGCLREEPHSLSLRLNEAEFLALRQRYDEAAKAYQQVLDREPRNVVALNNLAWILAADPATAEQARDLITRATREVGLTGDLLDTRARVLITLKEFDKAARDNAEALRQERTPLRLFHTAVLRLAQTPPSPKEAAEAFSEARSRGLDPKGVHPADLPTYRVLEAGGKPGN